MGRVEQRAEAVDELGRYLSHPHLDRRSSFSRRWNAAWPLQGSQPPEVLLDLHAHGSDELTVEVELDLLQHVFAVSR